MPAAAREKEFHPLCYEHLTEMVQCHADTALAYICSEPDCHVQYNTSRGYFIAAKDEQVGNGMPPSLRCPKDRFPMYLAEVHAEHRSYRLWKCPQCDKSFTNLDSSQAAAIS